MLIYYRSGCMLHKEMLPFWLLLPAILPVMWIRLASRLQFLHEIPVTPAQQVLTGWMHSAYIQGHPGTVSHSTIRHQKFAFFVVQNCCAQPHVKHIHSALILIVTLVRMMFVSVYSSYITHYKKILVKMTTIAGYWVHWTRLVVWLKEFPNTIIHLPSHNLI